MDQSAPTPQPLVITMRERASSMVEYVGLGALSAMLVSGIAAAIDSTAGDRMASAVVRRLLEVISGTS